MPFIEHQDVQYSDKRTIRDYLRELNRILRAIIQAFNENRRTSVGQVSHRLAAGTTSEGFFISDGAYDIRSVWYNGTATGTVALQINGVTVTGTSQTPPTSPTNYDATAARRLTRGDQLELAVTGTAAPVLASVVMRRLD